MFAFSQLFENFCRIPEKKPKLVHFLTLSILVLTEEILQTHIAHWWSPDGLRLAYLTINDTLVPKMEVPYFTGTPYPGSQDYHYPKVRLELKPSRLLYSSANSGWI